MFGVTVPRKFLDDGRLALYLTQRMCQLVPDIGDVLLKDGLASLLF